MVSEEGIMTVISDIEREKEESKRAAFAEGTQDH